MPRFNYPFVFLLLLLIPLFYVLRKLRIFSKPSFPIITADWNGQNFLWRKPLDYIAGFFSSFLFAVGYVCLVIALADPVITRQEKVYTSKGTDILFVLDASPSMTARDIAGGTRLEAAILSISTMVQEADGTGFGLVAMGSEAALLVPPTTDRRVFFDRLQWLSPGMLGDGTAIGEGISTAVYHLASSSSQKKCVVLLTDGENNAGRIHPETAARLVLEHDIVLYVLGVGTSGSVPIEYVDPTSGKVYSGYLESSFDSSVLERIAKEAGGRYFDIDSSGDLYTALASISASEQTVQSFYYKTAETSYYYVLLGISVIVFAVAWVLRRLYMGVYI